MKASITLPDVAATIEFGRQVGEQLHRGDVLALCGDLGAGKTHFAKGVAAALGSDPDGVTSPTFTLLHEYLGGRLPLYHFDFYRLDSADEAWRLGLEEYLEADGVCLIEWADKFSELLPPGTRWFRLQAAEDSIRLLTEADRPSFE